MIVLRSVAKEYRSRTALAEVTAEIGPGECICITGPSGSGKSTLVSLLLRAEDATRGEIEVDGVDIRSLPLPILQLYRSRLGTAFQEDRLLEQLSVVENVALPLELRGWPDAAIQRHIGEILSLTNLLPFARLHPPALSGGQRRLVALARAFVGSPMILLLDEPFQGLDAEGITAATALLGAARDRGATILLFTQDETLAKRLRARALPLREGAVLPASRAPTMGAAQSQHRILEVRDDTPPPVEPEPEPEPAPQPEPPEDEAPPPSPPKPRGPARGGPGKRRIRITAINSDLGEE